MLIISYANEDAELARRLLQDLRAKGHTISEAPQMGREHILITLISPAANRDERVQASITTALDNSQHIISVMAQTAPLPKWIDHLKPLDFAAGYPFQTLLDQISVLSSPNAGLPLKVLTPAARVKNRNSGYWLFALALLWFILGVVLVGFFGIQAPREEYNTIETQKAATIIVVIQGNLPRSTEDALNFPATVQAAPTAQRPLLVATATALATYSQK